MDPKVNAQIIRAHLLQELRERQKYFQRKWTSDEVLTLIMKIRSSKNFSELGIRRPI